MYSSTFIFATKQFDDDFHRLDQAIAEMAAEKPGTPGYYSEARALCAR